MCGVSGSLWPRPESARVDTRLADVSAFDRRAVQVVAPAAAGRAQRAELEAFLREAFDVFVSDANASCDGQIGSVRPAFSDLTLKVTVNVSSSADLSLDLDTDESYELSVSSSATTVSAVVAAANFFGARHGLETLSQLVTFDPDRRKLQVGAAAIAALAVVAAVVAAVAVPFCCFASWKLVHTFKL